MSRHVTVHAKYSRVQDHAGVRETTHLQYHELPERLVPLHQEDLVRRGAAEVGAAVEAVAGDGATHAALRVGHLGRDGEPARHEPLRQPVDRPRKGKLLRVLTVERQQVVAVQVRRLP